MRYPRSTLAATICVGLATSSCTLLVGAENADGNPAPEPVAEPDVLPGPGAEPEAQPEVEPEGQPSVEPSVEPEGVLPVRPGEPEAEPEAQPEPAPETEPDVGPGCVADDDFFEETILPILADCRACHVSDGLASHTRMILSPNADTPEADRAVLQDLATWSSVSAPLFIQKPTLTLPHVGGQLFAADSTQAANLLAMTHRFRQPGACEDPGPLFCSDIETDVQPLVRRLSNRELEQTLSDVFPTVALPTLSLVANENRNLFDNQSLSHSPNPLSTEYDHLNAQAIAAAVAANVNALLPCDPTTGASCFLQFVQETGRRLFRRPVSVEEEDLYGSFYDVGPTAGDVTVSAEVALQAMLESPAFLYRIELGRDALADETQLTAYETATRLAFFLWGTAPDDTLLDAAATGGLEDAAGVEAEVDRMLADDKANAGLMRIFEAWLDIGAVRFAQKAPAANFGDAQRQGFETETRRFLEDIVLGEDARLETVLTSNETFVNSDIASIYNLPTPGTPWARVTHTEPRFGVLTQGAFLASRGHAEQPSPIKRAKFILERLMCFEIGSPPPEAEGANIDDGDVVTNREATDALTLSGSCIGCHAIINPVGFTLERYGTTGAMRDVDNGQPVDDSGAFAATTFNGVGDMATFLVHSPMVHECVARRFSQYALGHELSEGECFVKDVLGPFSDSDYDLRTLVRTIAVHPAFAFGHIDKSFTGETP